MNPVLFHFVIPGLPGKEVRELAALDPHRHWQYFNDGLFAWTLQTYLFLKAHGQSNLSLGMEYRPDAVNLAHADLIRKIPPDPGVFLVAIQADFTRIPWAQMHIVQNQAQVRSGDTAWIPHWPQAGLIARDSSRKSVRTVAYMGRVMNYKPRFLGRRAGFFRVQTEVKTILSDLALELLVKPEDQWNDMHDVDLVIGLRSLDRNPYNTKPPTKLFNAWHARTPFIGGYDSAFSQVGRPDTDYVRVGTARELRSALTRLRDDPQVYRDLTAAGEQSATGFTPDAVARVWRHLLANEVQSRYSAWLADTTREIQRARRKIALAQTIFKTGRFVKRIIRLGQRG